MRWWPLDFRRAPPTRPQGGERHTAYIMWHFPLLSETFIQREISALLEKGLTITVLADAVPPMERLQDAARSLATRTVTVLPMDGTRSKAFFRIFLRRAPLRMLNVFLFLLFHRYHDRKSYRFDRHVFRKTVYIAGLCRELGVTHVHAPWADLNAVTGLLASRLLRVPFTVEARAHDIHRKTYLHGLRERFLYADLIITNSDYNLRYLKNMLGPGREGKIKRIYNCLPLEPFPYQRPRDIRDRPVRILSVARLIEQKGIDILLHACAELRRRDIDFRVVVAGGPEEGCEAHAEYLAGVRRDLELQDRVEFAGEKSLPEISGYHRWADLFVLPCRISGDGSRDITPNALIEAMASGLPCISTTVTAIPEIIDDGEDGLLVEPEEPTAIAGAITVLLSDPGRRKAMGERARNKVAARFDAQRNAQAFMDAFRSVG